jgi:mutual gliding-motility protein MglA
MALIDVVAKEIHCKIVYYGPALCGKTTNVSNIYNRIPTDTRGELFTLPTEGERTLFFDYLPLDLGSVRGFHVRFQIYTVPGQVIYEAMRKSLLTDADGVVFVADSQRAKLRDNVFSLRELARNITAQERDFAIFPLVLQYNKRDLSEALPISVLEYYLNTLKVPWFEAVATRGIGVLETLKAISRVVIRQL